MGLGHRRYFGAFAGKLTPELLTRWIEFGTVSGVMRTEANGFNLGPNTRPQIFDSGILPVWRRSAKLRTQLYPYLLAADGNYRRTGMPLMRDLALVYPGDETASGQEDEFMFGPDLLAAPVHQPGQVRRDLYLPGGRWIDFWRALSYRTGDGSLRLGKAKTLKGGRSVNVPAALDVLPLMVRAGAILPLLPANTQTLAGYGSASTVGLDDVAKRLHLVAFPRGKSRSPFGENGGLRSKEDKHAWKLTIRRAKRYRITLDASLTTLRHKLTRARYGWTGTACGGRRARGRGGGERSVPDEGQDVAPGGPRPCSLRTASIEIRGAWTWVTRSHEKGRHIPGGRGDRLAAGERRGRQGPSA